MTRCLIATFSLLVFVANQSFAAACVEACKQTSTKIQSEIVKASANNSDCHGHSKSKQPAKPDSSHDCGMTICAQSDIQVEVSVSQVKEKDNIKKLLIRGETVVPDLSAPLQTAFLNYSTSSLPLKIRLHLRLRRLLI